MHRRDAVLSEVRETLTVLTDRLIAKSAKRKSKRPPQPPEMTVGGSEHELSPPPALRRETTTPEIEPRRLKNKSATRPEVLLGTMVPSPPKSRPATTKNTVVQSLSQQEQHRQTAPPLHDPVQLRASPERCNAASPWHSAVDGRSMGQPPFRAGGCISHGPSHHVDGGDYGGGVGAGASGIGKRSPPPPSRSQPLRALVDCEERLPYRDRLRDSSGDKADPFRTPERRRRRGDQRARGGTSGNVLHNASSPSTLLRTADSHCAALEKQQAKAAQAVALAKRHRSYDTGGSNGAAGGGHGHHIPRNGGAPLYPPSWYDPKQEDRSRPHSGLVLEYVHGYAGETPDVLSSGVGGKFGGGVGGGSVGGGRNSATRSTNVLWLRSGEIVYPAAGVVVIHDFETNRQRFFTGHDEASEVTAVAVHPHYDIVASGQAGREAIVCLFDATRRRTGAGGGGRRGSQENDSSDSRMAAEAAEPSEAATAVAAPVFLREISLGKRKTRGVAALDFSPCGDLILAMAGGEGQSLSVWDWRRGERLAAARAESVHLPASSVRFNPWLFLQGTSAITAGLGPAGAACYTLVSCGERHVRFWALTREWCPRRGGGGGGVTVGGETYEDGMGGNERIDDGRGAEEREHGDGGGWRWSLSSRPGNCGVRGELGTMTCMAFIGEPRAGKEERQRRKRQATGGAEDGRLPLPMARAITGSENGQIYFWEISEAGQGKRLNKHQASPSHHHPRTFSPNRSGGGGGRTAREPVGWQPGGRLLAVVPKAHDGAITDVSYLPHGEDGRPTPAAGVVQAEAARARFGGGAGEGSSGGQEWGRLATCGGKGTLRLWSVAGEGPSPLQLLLTISVSNRGVGVGYPRSVSWDRSGTTLALGTVGNAVALVQPGEGTGTRPDQTMRATGNVMFMLAVQGHTHSCKALAPHPTRPWFITGGTDGVLKLWDARSRRQLSAARLVGKVCSAAFHPAGELVAVGSEAGDFLLMVLRLPPRQSSTTRHEDPNRRQDASAAQERDETTLGFSWDVLARKRIIGGGGGGASGHAPGRTSKSNSIDKRVTPVDARERFHRDGGATNVPVPANATFGGGEGDLAERVCDGAARNGGGGGEGLGADRRHRQPGPVNFAPRPDNDEYDGIAGASLTPPRPAKGNKDGLPSPQCRGSYAAMGASAAAAATAGKAMISVSALRFSPDGGVLAAACGMSIFLYCEATAAAPAAEDRAGAGTAREAAMTPDRDGRVAGDGDRNSRRSDGTGGVKGSYHRYAVCTGHVSKVRSFDFSRDGSVLQSNDASGELLFWEASSGKQISNSFSVRDVEMDSWSCPESWPAQGFRGNWVGGGAADGGRGEDAGAGITAVCRSKAEDVLAAGDGDGCIRVMRNPAPLGGEARMNWGHKSASGVSGLSFLCDDRRLVSVSGTCVFVWRHVRRPSSHDETGQNNDRHN
ncbi:unnamed protein product [Ectocarpus sp. 12 AP-2014]